MLMVARRDEYKRVITVCDSVDDSQHCLLNNTLQCSSFHYVLTHLQSGDYVNVTSNSVSLLIVVELQNINNITIRGQGNITVMCNNTGGVSCNNCSNVVIEGITWDQCGNPQRFRNNATGGINFLNLTVLNNVTGGINFHTILNLTVLNCTFQHSKVRALSLSVRFCLSNFVSNVNYDTVFCYSNIKTGYKGCGAKINAVTGGILIDNINTSSNRGYLSIHIENCVFSHNGYFGNVIIKSFRWKAPRVPFCPGLSIQVIEPTILINILIKRSIFPSTVEEVLHCT